jgi:CheY-like chemotaxis protein
MPGMNGLELAAHLKVKAGIEPQFIIATTAFGDLDTRMDTARGGFHYHLVKPVEFSVLDATITRLKELLAHRMG